GDVGVVPVDPLPAGLLTERRAVLPVPRIGGGHPQRSTRLTLVVRIADVVVGLVGLLDPRMGVGRRAVLAAEAPDVHLPEVETGLTLDDPLGHDLADAARARQPVRAEAGADE